MYRSENVPGEDPDDVGGVKTLVMKQLQGFTEMQSTKSNVVRPLPQRCAFPRQDVKKKGLSAFVAILYLIIPRHLCCPLLWHRTIAGKSTFGGSEAFPLEANLMGGNYDGV